MRFKLCGSNMWINTKWWSRYLIVTNPKNGFENEIFPRR